MVVTNSWNDFLNVSEPEKLFERHNAEIERNYDSGGSKTLRTLKLSYSRYENDIRILTFKK